MLKRNCDICHYEDNKHSIPAVYDAKTIYGPWAYVCQAHYESHTNQNPQMSTILATLEG